MKHSFLPFVSALAILPISTTASPGDLLWKFTTEASALSLSPSIGSDGTLYFGSSTNKIYAVDPNKGTNKWEFATGGPVNDALAVAADGTIYAGCDDGKLYAVTPGGAKKWTATTGGSISSTPAIGTDGTIYVGSMDHFLYAINPASGRTNWMFDVRGRIATSPAIGQDGTIYVGSQDTNLFFAVNRDGTETGEFRFPLPDDQTFSSPVVGTDGIVYVACFSAKANRGQLYALTPDLTVKWTNQDGLFTHSPSIGPDGALYASHGGGMVAFNKNLTVRTSWLPTEVAFTRSVPAIGEDGTVYFVSDGDGILYARNSDGSKKWSFTTGLAGKAGYSPILGWDGTVYFTYGRTLYAFQGTTWLDGSEFTGNVRPANSMWPMYRKNAKHNANAGGVFGDMLAHYAVGKVRGSPAIADDGTVYFGGYQWLYSLTPDRKLHHASSGNILSAPVIDRDGTVYVAADYVGDIGSEIMAYDRDLKLLWEANVAGPENHGENVRYSSPALAADGTIYLGTADGWFYAFNRARGAQWGWSKQFTKLSVGTLNLGERVSIGASPAIAADGTIYIGVETPGASDFSNHHLFALDPTGRILWQSPFARINSFSSSPAIGLNGTIHIADNYGLTAFRKDGTIIWTKVFGGWKGTSPIIGPDETVYLTAPSQVSALDPASGEERWRSFPLEASTYYSTPALGADGVLYFAAGKSIDAVKAVQAHFEFQWQAPLQTDDYVITSSPVLSPDGIVYVGSEEGLCVFKASSGPAAGLWPMFQRNAKHTGAAGDNRTPSFASVNLTVSPGSTFALNPEVNGTPPLRFQWQLNGVNIPGATNSSLVLKDVKFENGGTYTLAVENAFGAFTASPNNVVVGGGPNQLTDHFDDRARANSPSGVVFGSNSAAELDLEKGEPIPLGKLRSGRSVWFAWKAPASGAATVHTRGSGLDTLLGVYIGTQVGGLTLVAENDDGGGFLTSQVDFNPVAGTEYQIQIAAFGGKGGNVVLSWNLDTSAVAVPQIVQGPFSRTVNPRDSVKFTVQVAGQGPFNYQWLYNGQPILGATNAFLSLSNIDSVNVGSYSVQVTNASGRGAVSAPATLQINGTDTGGADIRVVTRNKLGDVVQLIGGEPPPTAVAKLNDRVRLQVSPFGAAPARGFSGVQFFDTTLSSKQPGEPNHCGEIGGASEWYAILAEDDGNLRVSTEGSSFDTVLAVYVPLNNIPNAIAFDELQPVTCDKNNSAGVHSSILFTATRSRIYHVAVDGVAGARGKVKLSYGLEPILTSQPSSLAVDDGSPAVFRVVSTGKPFYQWQFKGADISGATNDTLTIPNASFSRQGTYRVLVKNRAWSKISAEATLTVQVPRPKLEAVAFGTADARLHFRVTGGVGSGSVVQMSTDLVNWTPVFTNLQPAGPFDFIEPLQIKGPARFYRVMK